MRQVGLFGAPPPPVDSAPLDAETTALAHALPREVRLGTSTWTFPGWKGIVYDRAVDKKVLVEHGLAAYAKHPLLRTVGVDRTFYRPVSRATFRAWADAVPDGFRFLVKACEDTVLARYPLVNRYGDRAGKPNDRCFDPDWATEHVVQPWAEGLRDRAGPLLFQVPPQNPADFGGPERFAERLFAFLEKLPSPPPTGFYAVEVRNPELMTRRLQGALEATNTVPSLVVHPRMPDLRTQWRGLGVRETGPVVVRWMLQRGMDYETAKARFAPFDQLAAPDESTRDTIAKLCRAMAKVHRPVWVIMNNKAEGSAPLSAAALAAAIRAL